MLKSFRCNRAQQLQGFSASAGIVSLLFMYLYYTKFTISQLPIPKNPKTSAICSNPVLPCAWPSSPLTLMLQCKRGYPPVSRGRSFCGWPRRTRQRKHPTMKPIRRLLIFSLGLLSAVTLLVLASPVAASVRDRLGRVVSELKRGYHWGEPGAGEWER